MQRPADEFIYLILPFTAVGHIEHTRLEIGYHQGTEREILVDAVLTADGIITALLHKFIDQAHSLRTSKASS